MAEEPREPDVVWSAGVVARHTLTLFLCGDGSEAAAAARTLRPAVPLPDAGAAIALAVRTVVTLEGGEDWELLADDMAETLRLGVAAGDPIAAGMAALALAKLDLLRGRYRDAAGRLDEAEDALEREDPARVLTEVRSVRVGVACATGDADGAAAALERLRGEVEDRPLLPTERPAVLRAEGWVARSHGEREGARRLLEAAIALEVMPPFAAQLGYEALRAGASGAAAELTSLASVANNRLARAYAAHAVARANRDGAALLEAAEAMVAIGALRYAVEAASDAATAFGREGRRDDARRAAARARELHPAGQGGALPAVPGLDPTS